MLLWSVVLLTLLSQLISSEDTLINETQNNADGHDARTETKDDNLKDSLTDSSSLTNESHELSDSIKISARSRHSNRNKPAETLENTVALAGSSLKLPCRGFSHRMQWMFTAEGTYTPLILAYDCEIDERYVRHCHIDKSNKACNLVIKSLTTDMAGTYTCVERGPNNKPSSAKLIVLESGPSCKSSVERQEFLIAGYEVRFSCSVRYAGAMPPVMKWTDQYDRIIIPNSLKSDETYVESNVVVKAQVPGLGRYSFKAYFTKIGPKRSSEKVLAAVNAPEYTFHWSSKPLLVYTNENLALRKKAIQSSTLNWYSLLGAANLAVDGNTNGYFSHGSCTHTEEIYPAWWAVDLGQERTIGRVRITNRDFCCADRLANFYIGLTNVSPWTTAPRLETSSICKYYIGFPPGGIPTGIYCDPNTAHGRYLFVLQTKQSPLTICELEVYGR